MININILHRSYLPSKMSLLIKNKNLFVFKVHKKCNKLQILDVVEFIYKVKVQKVCTLVVKSKCKRNKNGLYYTKSWKKAYVFLKK